MLHHKSFDFVYMLGVLMYVIWFVIIHLPFACRAVSRTNKSSKDREKYLMFFNQLSQANCYYSLMESQTNIQY